MKCPKCGYLGFEDADHCRHCGYEFSLSRAAPVPELPLRRDDESVKPLDDFTLIDASAAPGLAQFASELPTDAERLRAPERDTETGEGLRSPSKGATSAWRSPEELPLFERTAEDLPLAARRSAPRPPLAVRRSKVEVPRFGSEPARAAFAEPLLDLDIPSNVRPGLGSSERAQEPEWLEEEADAEDAALLPRAAAVVLDFAVLLAVDAVVIYFTMQICGLTIDEFGLLPKAPLVAFLVVQNVGYLVAFTAGGQTLGKMAAGIKIVAADPHETVDVGCALKRTVAWLVLLLPAGLGFLTAVFRPDHRGLHDRFAGTRVVRASA
jgi:uncharacterized RDD family membrane protein YckC